jgi:hypothetical protein
LTLPAAASAATFTASATDAELGNAVHATATLAGGNEPAEGTIEFTAFAPADPTCIGGPVFSATVSVSGNGEYSSGNFTPAHAGSYHWTAAYSGDSNGNEPESSICTATSLISQATPALSTLATSAVVGAAVHDTATLSGGVSPTGTLTFKAFGPNDTTCTNTAAFTAAIPVSGNAAYESGDFTSSQAGSYRWTVVYSGDADNAAATSPCNSANETSTVSKASPGISSSATNAVVGAAIKDTATISGGASPTGSLVFKAFGPGDASCSNPAAYTKTVAVAGNAAYESGDFTTSIAGTYRWTIDYSGDTNNNAVSSPCNAANETSTVGQVTPTLSSTATSAVVGTAITDSATLSGGFVPTGTLTFKAFGPENATCSGAAAYTKTVTVSGNASYGSENFTTSAAGTYRWTVAYSGDTNNAAITSPCNAANETSTVGKVTPGITTVATNGSVGTAIKDTATISGGAAPTGNLVFKAFGPNDATCANAAAFTKTVTVSGNGEYGSTNFIPSAVGAYRWTVEYAGDANNAAITSPCGATNETSTVTQVTPTLSSTATSAVVGATIKDTATLAGGASPTGNLVFKAFGPNDATCSGTVAYTKTVTVAGAGSYGSEDFTTSAAGTYRWTISYSGDANNGATSSACNAANETSTVSPATPGLSSTAASGVAGGTISDTANLSGGFNPTGTLTFKAFGPENATCSGAAAYTKTVTVSGNASYGSESFTTALAGSYRWTIDYSGDANNNAVSSPCNAANETSTVGKASPALSTTATANGAVGSAIKDTATISGNAAPTGSLVFKTFGPNDATCAGTVAYTKTVTVAGAGSYGSGDFETSAVGTYRWTADYSGDANNNAVSSPCNAANETSTVGKASPALSSVAASSIYPNPISDTATVTGGFTPAGTLTFKAFGPGNATCAGAAVFSKGVAVNNGNASYNSTNYTETQIGDYRWTIDYSGDANNNATTSVCNAANETSTVAKVPPAITVSTTGDVAIGRAIASFATFGGGLSHTGQVVFRAYGPNDPSCSGTPAFTSSPPLPVTAGNPTYASGLFTPAQAGAFRWTAEYSGDAINAAETTPCAAAVASVAAAVPTISAHISATGIIAGDGVSDTATLAGGFNPAGTLTFRLFGPNDTACGSPPALTGTVAVAGNGTYTSAALVPPQAGDYRFTVTYSGDTGNTTAVSACGGGGEFVRVQKRTPTLKALASVRGKKIVAKATLSGAVSPRGKITFRIYAPGDSRCSRKPVFSSQAAVHGTGNYSSAGYRFDKAGLYRFTVAYSGDERNKSLKKGCATRGQSVRAP